MALDVEKPLMAGALPQSLPLWNLYQSHCGNHFRKSELRQLRVSDPLPMVYLPSTCCEFLYCLGS